MKHECDYEKASIRVVELDSAIGFLEGSPIAKNAWSVHTKKWYQGDITEGITPTEVD